MAGLTPLYGLLLSLHFFILFLIYFLLIYSVVLSNTELDMLWLNRCAHILNFIELNVNKIICIQISTELNLSTANFAKSAAMLGNVEEHTALSRALSQLAETEEKIEVVHKEQAEADFFTMSELMKDYVALMGAVKVGLLSLHMAVRALLCAKLLLSYHLYISLLLLNFFLFGL